MLKDPIIRWTRDGIPFAPSVEGFQEELLEVLLVWENLVVQSSENLQPIALRLLEEEVQGEPHPRPNGQIQCWERPLQGDISVRDRICKQV